MVAQFKKVNYTYIRGYARSPKQTADVYWAISIIKLKLQMFSFENKKENK